MHSSPARRLSLILLLILAASLLFADDLDRAREQRQALIAKAKEYIGCPYVTGGTTSAGFDCSGLINTVAKQAIAVDLPRTVAQLYDYVKVIPDSKKEAGDLLFFKTVGDRISHVALYIGNNQFIHSASDGPNTGVIISSLNESYWKKTYYGAGQFLPSTMIQATAAAGTEGTAASSGSSTTAATGSGAGTAAAGSQATVTAAGTASAGSSFLSSLSLSASASINWSFLSPTGFQLSIRGGTFDIACDTSRTDLDPGIAVKFRWDPAIKAFQIPIVITLATSKYLRFYAGPVLTAGSPVLPDYGTPIQASVFPGIIGLSWMTESFSMFGLQTKLMQDLSFTIFNDTAGAALPPLQAFASGMYFSTGLRVTLPVHLGV